MRENMSKKETFKQYLKILFLYSAFVDKYEYDLNEIQIQVLYKPNFDKTYNEMDINEYNNCLLGVLYNDDYHYCPITFLGTLTEMLMNTSEQNYENFVKDCVITIKDIENSNLILFKKYINNEINGYSDYTQRLYQLCIANITNNIHYHLSEANTAMLNFLQKDKSYKYLKPFYWKTDNGDSIQFYMHLYCKEIFDIKTEGDDMFLNYIASSDIDDKQKQLIGLYWNRYKNADSHYFGYYPKGNNQSVPSEENIINGLIFY